MRLALPALALAGCANVLGIPDETQVRTYKVSANVTGVDGASDPPVTLYLTDSGTNERQTLVVNQDGVSVFARGLDNGVMFELTSTAACGVKDSARPIDGADVIVDVSCDGILGLADFGFSAPLETMGVPGSYRTYGSLLTFSTWLKPVTRYSESTATAYKGGVQVQSVGVPVMHNDQFEVRVTNPTSALPVTTRSFFTGIDLVGPPAQFGYGKAPASADSGHYGSALDSFEPYVVVGTPDNGKGRAVLYSRFGRKWTEVAVFEGDNAGSRYGAAVAIGKDNIAGKLVVAVGAPGENVVYIYKQNGMQWDRTPLPGTGEYGTALAIEKLNSGALLMIGAPSATGGSVANAGRVDVYNIQTMAPATGYQAITPTSGARFGAALSLSETLPRAMVVGAPSERSDVMSTSNDEAGAAYLFDVSGVTSPMRLVAPNVGAADHFGAAVAMSADGMVVAIGAPLEDSGSATSQTDNSMNAAGAVYLFSAATPTGVYVKAANVDVGDGFGSSVSLRGNLTDGLLLAVGAPFEDSAATGVGQGMTDETAPDAGAVYLYSLQNTTPTFKHYIKASNAATGDAFGASVLVAGDSLLVAAPYEDSNATGWNNGQGDGDIDGDNGAVYAFR